MTLTALAASRPRYCGTLKPADRLLRLEKGLQRDRRSLLALLDQRGGGLEDARMQRIEEMLRRQEAGHPVERGC